MVVLRESCSYSFQNRASDFILSKKFIDDALGDEMMSMMKNPA